MNTTILQIISTYM